jgi:hypothetical protein
MRGHSVSNVEISLKHPRPRGVWVRDRDSEETAEPFLESHQHRKRSLGHEGSSLTRTVLFLLWNHRDTVKKE